MDFHLMLSHALMVMIFIALFSVTCSINKGIYLFFLLFEAQTEDAENFTRLSAL